MESTQRQTILLSLHHEILRRCGDVLPEYCYIIDFDNQLFHNVTDHYETFKGWPTVESIQVSWKHREFDIAPEDASLFENIRKVIVARMTELGGRLDQVMYFAFHYKFRFPLKGLTEHLMAYLKIAPVMVKGFPRYGCVTVTSSIANTSGRLRAYFKDSDAYEEYDPATDTWHDGELPRLSLSEQHILLLTRMGYDVKSIADRMHLSSTTIRNIMNKMYRKLGVNTITQAVLYAWDHRMIYVPAEDPPRKNPRSRYMSIAKAKMTPEVLEKIQRHWNNGRSINSIAKEMDLSEGAIRYAVRKGRLTTPHYLRRTVLH